MTEEKKIIDMYIKDISIDFLSLNVIFKRYL